MRLDTRDIPPPPDEPTGGQSCDGGHCNEPSVGWRYYPTPRPGQWLPVCRWVIGNAPAAFRRYDESEAK